MGKGSTKKKPKWKSLELETPAITTTATATATTPDQGLDPQHPFLKMISKKVETAQSTEKQQQANDGSNSIHLYRSSRHLGVPPSAPPSQYVGAPIQYCPTKWVDQTNQHLPPQEVLLQTAGPEVVYPQVAAAEVISEVVGQEMYQQLGSQEVYQHPVVFQEAQRPEVYQPTSHKTYTVQAGVTYQVPTVAVERNGLTEYVPDPKQVPGLNYFPVEQNGLADFASSPPVSQEYAASYTASTSDYTSEYVLSSPECVPASPEFPPQPPAISAEVAVPPAQYVQYVPYYFYYPVGVPANVHNNSTSVPGVPAARARSQPVLVQSQTSSSSSASSDSYAVRSERKGGGRRRRRKRGESEGKLEKVPMVRRHFVIALFMKLETFPFQEAALGDVDSGYLNGEESSSEQGSEREGEEDGQAEITDSGMEVTQRHGLAT